MGSVAVESIVGGPGVLGGPPVDGSEIGQHLIQGSGVDRRIHPAGAVRGHLPKDALKAGDQAIVGIILTGDLVVSIIVLQPQGDVPGLPVCPSVEGVGAHRFRLN
jgi:hypothetical protein